MKYSAEITYMIYLLNNVEEDIIKTLIGFMYDTKAFFNPYDTYKEFLLNLFLGNPDDIELWSYIAINYLQYKSPFYQVKPQMINVINKIPLGIKEKLENFKYESCGDYYKFINLKPSSIDTPFIMQ